MDKIDAAIQRFSDATSEAESALREIARALKGEKPAPATRCPRCGSADKDSYVESNPGYPHFHAACRYQGDCDPWHAPEAKPARPECPAIGARVRAKAGCPAGIGSLGTVIENPYGKRNDNDPFVCYVKWDSCPPCPVYLSEVEVVEPASPPAPAPTPAMPKVDREAVASALESAWRRSDPGNEFRDMTNAAIALLRPDAVKGGAS